MIFLSLIRKKKWILFDGKQNAFFPVEKWKNLFVIFVTKRDKIIFFSLFCCKKMFLLFAEIFSLHFLFHQKYRLLLLWPLHICVSRNCIMIKKFCHPILSYLQTKLVPWTVANSTTVRGSVWYVYVQKYSTKRKRVDKSGWCLWSVLFNRYTILDFSKNVYMNVQYNAVLLYRNYTFKKIVRTNLFCSL